MNLSPSRFLIALLLLSTVQAEEKELPLYAFIAEKVAIEHLPFEEGDDEYKFKAQYRNLQNIHGDLPLDIIEFTGSDPIYVDPKFSRYDHVILYLTENEDGSYHHIERVYSVIYKTADGKWAGPVNWDDIRNKANLDTTMKPVDITFPPESGKRISDAQVEHMYYYPEIWEPNFIIENNTVLPVKGNYVPELFELKKNGVLKDRGFFGGREEGYDPKGTE